MREPSAGEHAVMQLEENTFVDGRFRLSRLLGRGGMGSVWQATDVALDVQCAVKFIEGEMNQVPEARARFEREAKSAAGLRSPHVVQILHHGVWEGRSFIAMELLEGEDLGKRLARLGKLPPADLHSVMSQVCRALSKAHTKGIVHRDLKPDNIFIVKDDDREIVKVLDFGIAKATGHDLGGSSNTKTGAMLGTPYYMSPEQAQGTKAVDWRSDLWALAVICFQALTGRLPFESEALGDLLVKIIMLPVPVPSQLSHVPPTFDRWWLKAAARDPGERYQSAKEFSDSLALVCEVSQVSGILDRPFPTGVAAAGMTSPATQPGTQTGTQTGTQPGVFVAQAVDVPLPAGAGTAAPMSRTHTESAQRRSMGVWLGTAGGLLTLLCVGGAGIAILNHHHRDEPAVASPAAPPDTSAIAPASPVVDVPPAALPTPAPLAPAAPPSASTALATVPSASVPARSSSRSGAKAGGAKAAPGTTKPPAYNPGF